MRTGANKDTREFPFPPDHNTGGLTRRTVLPLPPSPGEEARFEMEVYARFMRHLRHVPSSRADVKVLASIQFTADMMDTGEALVARVLVDQGLRAPRRAFPASFIDFADRAAMRMAWGDDHPPSGSMLALREHWDRIGEGRFGSALRSHYAVYSDTVYA